MGKTFTTIGELKEVTRVMRELGIQRLKLDMMEVDLLPERPETSPPSAPLEPEEVEEVKGLAKPAEKGQDGLTADEQADLYGRVFDAPPSGE
jgi:hypothetical protein